MIKKKLHILYVIAKEIVKIILLMVLLTT